MTHVMPRCAAAHRRAAGCGIVSNLPILVPGFGSGHDVLHAIEALLVRAQQASAVRPDARMPEVLALLSATCLAAKQQHWAEPLRNRALGIIFDGLRG
jgi:hypothetical protein